VAHADSQHPGSPRPSPAAAGTLTAVLLAAVLATATACSPRDSAAENAAAGSDRAAPETAAAAGAAATAGGADTAARDGVPACRFQAPEEELAGRASPPDSASVELGGATARICYGAPSMRGRRIVGGLVPYGKPWRLGANEPTTLHLPFAARLGGVALQPGSYSLYAIPGPSEWTVVVNGDTDRWGIPIDEDVRKADVGSFTVRPDWLAEPVERLSIRMETSGPDEARVVVSWERTSLSFPLQRAGD